MKTILIATGLYPPDIGGPATHTVFLEKHASELGLILKVVTFGRVRKYPPFFRHLIYLGLIIRASRGCEYLYALDAISVGFPVRVASLITRIPYILRVPGDYAWEQGQQRFGITETLDEFRTNSLRRPLPVRILSSLQSHVARNAKRVIVPSEYLKNVVCGWGVKEERITRIYSVLKELSTEEPSLLPFSPLLDTFIISTAARLVPWKGMRTLIDVVVRMRGDGLKVHLHIFGDGILKEELQNHASEVKARDIVTFHGAVSRDELAHGLKKSHAFVLNTSYEGLSHQLIEVMSLGVSIVTTPVGGNIELIEHERTGLLVPYDNSEALYEALVRLRQDPELRRTLTEEARKALSDFSEQRIVSELRALFVSL